MKLNESGSKRSKTDEDPSTPPKDSDTEAKQDDNDEDFLDVANDVNFEEEDEENVGKNSTAAKDDEKSVKDESEKSSPEKVIKAGSSSTADKESKRAPSEKSPSKEKEMRSSTLDLNCVHCLIKCLSVQVSLKKMLKPRLAIHTMNFHRTFVIISPVDPT